MDDVFNTTGRIVNVFKAKYARSYPFVAYSAKIHPCVPTTGGTTSFSYPSGHTTGGIVSACALAVIFPDQAADIWKHGEYQGDLRVIIGRHYPTDVKAGKRWVRPFARCLGKIQNLCAKQRLSDREPLALDLSKYSKRQALKASGRPLSTK
jgi:hypothetical protein